MGTELLFIGVLLLVGFAILDLVVGVSNDAVNFLNSSIGSRVAPRHVIMIIASLGIMAGVIFSSGMMEVARKGIFHPQLFTMPELMTIFLGVMLADVILLDLFNTFGMPTSTTVSIVFELLGAAVAVSILKILQVGEGLASLDSYINTKSAMVIISGILLSVVVAFVCGALVQFLSRLLFTFDYKRRLRRYGALWGGVAMASITYFILVKGAKGVSFITPEENAWIKGHTVMILVGMTAVSAVGLQLLLLRGFNILKPIVLVGTFALALAFAANDLVNFIGVPMAGKHAYDAAMATSDPLSTTMEALAGKVRSETILLLLAGAIMVVTLWISRKARSVTETEVNLGRQEEGLERFGSTLLSRSVVRMFVTLSQGIARAIPRVLRGILNRRLDPTRYHADTDAENRPSFDLLRASVNLMVASAVVSFATSQKLPLSTTYVTFMVAMGSSFADRAWGLDTAVYRVTGVLTVIGGWFLTALAAFTLSAAFALLIYYTGAYGVAALLLLAIFCIVKTRKLHREREQASEDQKIFNLRKIKDAPKAVATTFTHMASLLREIRQSLDSALEGLFDQNIYRLRVEKNKNRTLQNWSNIIIANVFKAMRLLQKEDAERSCRYAQTIRRLQKMVDGHRDIVFRAYMHVSNHHKGLLPAQVEDLRRVGQMLQSVLLEVEQAIEHREVTHYAGVVERDAELRALAERLNDGQIARIQDRSSHTRLSILFYAIVGNAMMLSKQNLKILDIFEKSFAGVENQYAFDLE